VVEENTASTEEMAANSLRGFNSALESIAASVKRTALPSRIVSATPKRRRPGPKK
jgi:hypothetical protein